jgi:carbamoyl-phosphate synthase large subunit
MTTNVLIFGVGGPTPLGIARSLRLRLDRSELRLIGVDGDSFAPGLYNRELFDATRLNGFTREPDYWEIIEEIVERERIHLAYVVPEGEVLAWAERQADGALPCKAMIPDLAVARSMYDKMACNQLLDGTDLGPTTLAVDRNCQASDLGESLGYPYWVRKAEGAGAIGALRIDTAQDLQNWLNMNPEMEGLIASEFLPGRNYACKVLYFEGRLVRAACGERISYLLASAAPSGVSGICARGRLINYPELIRRSDQAVRCIFEHHRLAPHGMFTVDFKEDSSGIPRLTEINIRHVSFTHAFALGGANFAYDTYELLIRGELSNPDYVEYHFEDEPHFIRGVDSEIFIVPDADLVRI